MTLEDAWGIAAENSPAAAGAEASYMEGRASWLEGWGGLMPTLSTTAGYSRFLDQDTYNIGGYEIPGAPPGEYYQLGVTVTEPIFTGGFVFNRWRSGRAAGRAGEADRADKLGDLKVGVAEAFFGALKAEKLLEVTEKSLEASENNVRIAEVNFETGAISRAEYLKAVVQAGTDRVALIAAEAAAKNARLAFFSMLGVKPDDAVVLDDDLPMPEPTLPPLDDILARAEENRPDIVANEYNTKVAEYTVGMMKAGRWPNIYASASYDWSDYQSPWDNDSPWDANDSWTLGITIQYELLDGFATRAAVRRAEAAARVARANLDILEETVEMDVTTAYYEYEKQAETVVVARETAEAADEEFEIVNRLYELDGASALELTDAQALYVQAQNAYIEALYDFYLADIKLKKATGDL
ncbi:MAG: TolC family protein [Candidatus Coatesbacteria bacterium]|nr:MAG: TolC family protein [Candidatus Coatesbacteria bacterium]